MSRLPTPRRDPAPTARLPVRALVGAALILLSMGLLVSSLGPLLPGLQGRFDVGPTAAGVLVAAVPLGGLGGVLLFYLLADRYDVWVLLAACCAAMGLGQLGVALAPAWGLLLVAGMVIGLGFGAAMVLVNGIVATVYGLRSTYFLNLLNGAFGVGAVLGPLCVAALPDGSDRLAYLGYGTIMAIGPALFAGLPSGTRARAARVVAVRAGTTVRQPARVPLHQARLAGFALLFAAYVALEVATGGWAASHLLGVGVDADGAARATSLFWVGIAAGRILLAPVGLRTGPGPLLLGASVCACLCLLVVWVAPLGGWSYLAVGFAMGPVFPTGLAWVTQDLPATRSAVAVMVVAGNVGALLLPPAVGAVVGMAGATAAPLPLAACAAVCAVAVAVLLRADPAGRAVVRTTVPATWRTSVPGATTAPTRPPRVIAQREAPTGSAGPQP